MKKLLLPLLMVCHFAQAAPLDQCTPKIQQQKLTNQPTNQPTNHTPVFFAGFIIELPSPKKIGYFNENLILKYSKGKTIYLTYSTAILAEGRPADYDPVAIYKEAFGISPRQAKNKSEIQAIINLQRLCHNELINYQINGIDDQVIRTKYQNKFNDNSITTFILSKTKDVYMITFKGFTNSEIDQLLATIHKRNNK